MIPMGENYFITVDMDGLDPTFMSAVSHPEPGGLTFRESLDQRFKPRRDHLIAFKGFSFGDVWGVEASPASRLGSAG